LTLQYGFGASYAAVTSWLSPGTGFDFSSVVGTTTAAPIDGNVTGRVAGLGGTVATNWAVGDTLWIRWTDVDNTGGDHGLALHKINLSGTAAAAPWPGTHAPMLAGLGAGGLFPPRPPPRRGPP
ncbi:hypothetical protein WDZ92_46245, partial [Nostoc sp. NIES-2111]